MRLMMRTAVPSFAAVVTVVLVMLSISFRGNADTLQNDGWSQLDATAQAATVESAVDHLFTQTADAQANIGLTQTVNAAFNAALTATADYNATVEVAFNAALTATALSQATLTPTPYPVADLKVISALDIDLRGGPLNTGAYLSPDGTRFAHAQAREGICFYNVLGMLEQCTSFEDTLEMRAFDPDTLYWSPDGEWITFTSRSLVMFRDSDIWVIRVSTGELINLTDDGTEELDFITPSDTPADLDLSPRWLPDGRVVFLRYNRVEDITSAPNLLAVSPEGGEVERLGVLPHGNRPLLVVQFSPSPDGTQVIYPVDRIDEQNAGIWVSDITGDNARRIWSLAPDDLPEEMLGLMPHFGEFSPDGQYALVAGIDTRFSLRIEPTFSPVRYSDLADKSSDPNLIDPNTYVAYAGWSPDQSVLAYLVSSRVDEETSGLYLTAAPGEPGRLVYPGEFFVPTSLQRQPIIWGANNTILLARREDQKLVALTLGQ